MYQITLLLLVIALSEVNSSIKHCYNPYSVTELFSVTDESVRRLNETITAMDSRCSSTEVSLNVTHDRLNEHEVSIEEIKRNLSEVEKDLRRCLNGIDECIEKQKGTRADTVEVLKQHKQIIDGISEDVAMSKTNIQTGQTKLDEIQQNLTDLKQKSDKAVVALDSRTNSTEKGLQEARDYMNKHEHSISDIKRNIIEVEKEGQKCHKRIDESFEKQKVTNGHVNEFIKSHAEKIEVITEDIALMKAHIERGQFNMDTMQTDLLDLKEKAQKVTTKTSDLEAMLNKIDVDAKERLKTVEKSFNQIIQEQRQTIQHLEEELNKEQVRVTAMQTEIDRMKTDFDKKLEESISKEHAKIIAVHAELTQFKNDMLHDVKTLSSAKSGLQQRLAEQQDKVNIIYPNTFNKESVSLLGVVMVCWLLGLSLVVMLFWRQKSAPGDGTVQRNQNTKIIDLENTVLVVSYKDSLSEQYTTLATSVCGEAAVKTRFVNIEQDLADLPKARVTIMFVEYSERHVIIETPGLGLGSLKRKTAEFVHENEGCLVIVYARDHGSRSLRSHQRYNQDIGCVTSQPELATLDDAGQFFSIYSEFTEFQKNCLRNIMFKHLKIQ